MATTSPWFEIATTAAPNLRPIGSDPAGDSPEGGSTALIDVVAIEVDEFEVVLVGEEAHGLRIAHAAEIGTQQDNLTNGGTPNWPVVAQEGSGRGRAVGALPWLPGGSIRVASAACVGTRTRNPRSGGTS